MGWNKLDNDLKSNLVHVRDQIGTQRQTQFATDFRRLTGVFEKRSLLPYDVLSQDVYDELNKTCPYFKDGGHWGNGDTVNNFYFYRVETMESFLRKHWHLFYRGYKNFSKITIPEGSMTPPEIFNIIRVDYERTGQAWMPLERLVDIFFNYRNFSWWTNDYNFDLAGQFPSTFEGKDLSKDNEWLLDFAFKAGITSDWLSSHMIFLRLDSTLMDSDDIKIPSIIDALLQPIFSPRQLSEEKRWGLAFDLSKTLVPRQREYVIRNIPVEAVEFFPVKLDDTAFDLINPNARLNDEMVRSLIDNI